MTARYNTEFILKLPIRDYIGFLKAAVEKDREHEIYEQWTALLPFMYMKYLKYMPFKEYLDAVTGRNLDMRPIADIRKDLDEAFKES